jgi:hypothetical protein
MKARYGPLYLLPEIFYINRKGVIVEDAWGMRTKKRWTSTYTKSSDEDELQTGTNEPELMVDSTLPAGSPLWLRTIGTDTCLRRQRSEVSGDGRRVQIPPVSNFRLRSVAQGLKLASLLWDLTSGGRVG